MACKVWLARVWRLLPHLRAELQDLAAARQLQLRVLVERLLHHRLRQDQHLSSILQQMRQYI